MRIAANSILGGSPVISGTELKLNQSPAPKTNAYFYDDLRKGLH